MQLAAVYHFGKILLLKYFHWTREQRKLNSNLLTVIKTTIINLWYEIHEKFNAMFRSTEYLPTMQSLYRISFPFIAKRTNTLWTIFVVNVWWLFPFFFHSYSISILNVVQLYHTLQRFSSSCLLYLFIYMVGSNATISSKLLHARSLTRCRIPELFK